MAYDNEVKQIKYRGRRYTFRYCASSDQWVPVNQKDGGLRTSPVPREVWRGLDLMVAAAEAAKGIR